MNLVLHLGAHRTGSTSLQNYLQANIATLSASRTELWLPSQLRRIPDFGQAPTLVEIGDAEGIRRLSALRLAIQRRANSTPARTIVLSEENLIGGMQGNLISRSLYRSLEIRLSVYADLLQLTPMRIGLAIRSYETYWLSCYLHVLRRRAIRPIAQITDDLVNGCADRGWYDIVAGIRKCFPTSEICVWQAEATKKEGVGNIATRLVDGKLNFVSMPQNQTSNTGLQLGYLWHLEDLRRRCPRASRRDTDKYLQSIEPIAAISPFTQTQAETMRMSYARAVERIAGLPNVKYWAA